MKTKIAVGIGAGVAAGFLASCGGSGDATDSINAAQKMTPTPSRKAAAGCGAVTWSNNDAYKQGAIVIDGDKYYIATHATTAGIDPTISTWYWSPYTCSTPTPAPTPSGLIYSPYFYSGDYSTAQLTTAVTGTSETLLKAMPSKLQAITWAFATGSCGSENWSGVSASSFAAANVQSFVGAGKKYIVSTGGAGANFTCSSDANFTKFIKTYYSANMLGVDFDIENTQSQSDVENLVERSVTAEKAYPDMRFSFTVATDGGNEAQSLGSYGVMVMNAIKKYGLKNYAINLMVMDFADSGQEDSSLCTLASNGKCEMGQSSIAAAKSLHDYWGVPYSQIELTPMIGGNDSIDETFTIADAQTVSSFALSNKLGGIHFWSFERDRDCAPATRDNDSSDTCNNDGKAGTLGYTNAFLSGLGY